jgi:hypothetical protein
MREERRRVELLVHKQRLKFKERILSHLRGCRESVSQKEDTMGSSPFGLPTGQQLEGPPVTRPDHPDVLLRQ